jgi:hypothetical protein
MATARGRRYDVESLGQAGALVAVCTLVLTASFVGLLALVAGRATGVSARLPLYVLGMAAAFVGAILWFESRSFDGRTTLATAGTVGFGTFVLALLGAEGVVYTLTNPGEVVASQLVFYFLAAGMIATGLGYWAVHHWQELSVEGRGVAGSGSLRR